MNFKRFPREVIILKWTEDHDYKKSSWAWLQHLARLHRLFTIQCNHHLLVIIQTACVVAPLTLFPCLHQSPGFFVLSAAPHWSVCVNGSALRLARIIGTRRRMLERHTSIMSDIAILRWHLNMDKNVMSLTKLKLVALFLLLPWAESKYFSLTLLCTCCDVMLTCWVRKDGAHWQLLFICSFSIIVAMFWKFVHVYVHFC